jgi:prepilin-type N-terminal cleavage/methylation domain-containing protein
MTDMTNKFSTRPTSPLAAPAQARAAFTLIELLTVIAVIAILAGLLFPVFNMIKNKSLIQTATTERDQLETAIESYKAKYGFYPPSNANPALSLTNQLYYELIGTTSTNNGGIITFTTLDSSSMITGGAGSTVMTYFGVSGFMNCTRGTGDDAVAAKTFLGALRSGQIATNGDVYMIVTRVNSGTYKPTPSFKVEDGYNTANPWRYQYPGVNNPNSYDLWIQIIVAGKTNLICNWANGPQYNSTLP